MSNKSHWICQQTLTTVEWRQHRRHSSSSPCVWEGRHPGQWRAGWVQTGNNPGELSGTTSISSAVSAGRPYPPLTQIWSTLWCVCVLPLTTTRPVSDRPRLLNRLCSLPCRHGPLVTLKPFCRSRTLWHFHWRTSTPCRRHHRDYQSSHPQNPCRQSLALKTQIELNWTNWIEHRQKKIEVNSTTNAKMFMGCYKILKRRERKSPLSQELLNSVRRAKFELRRTTGSEPKKLMDVAEYKSFPVRQEKEVSENSWKSIIHFKL